MICLNCSTPLADDAKFCGKCGKPAVAPNEKIDIEKPFVYHLRHSERWDPDLWRMFGSVFMRIISKELEQTESGGHFKSENYKSQFNEIMTADKTKLNYFMSLANRYYILKNYLHDKKLSKMARLNMRFIEQNK